MSDDAPARLAYFWRTVGWAPGVGLGWGDGGLPPVRELGRADADGVLRRWLGAECFAPTTALPEPTVAALWARLPKRCWVLRASAEMYHSRGGRCHGGSLYYVDEDAGDDPPLMTWFTRRAAHDTGPVYPQVEAASSLAYLMGNTPRMPTAPAPKPSPLNPAGPDRTVPRRLGRPRRPPVAHPALPRGPHRLAFAW